MNEITIILHTSKGDVRTTYPFKFIEEAIETMRSYTKAMKNFSIQYN